MGNTSNVIKIIILINVVLFVVTFYFPGAEIFMIEKLALWYPGNSNFQFWQMVTTMFMHGSFMHILFNMYALWAFGTPLAKIWGDKRFTIFYFVAGIGASIIYTLVNMYQLQSLHSQLVAAGIDMDQARYMIENGGSIMNVPQEFEADLNNYFSILFGKAVGASGAIYGVLVAFGIMFPNAKLALIFLPVPIAAKYFIPALILMDLFSGLTGVSLFGGGIAHFAHIGGALIGFLLMMYWRKKLPRYRPY